MVISLIIISRLMHQAEGVLIKRYNSKYNNGGFIFTAIVSLFSMLFFVFMDIFSDVNGLQFNSKLLLYGIISGLCFCGASFLTYVALSCGSFVLSRLILSYGILITVAHGLFIGETLSVFAWIGIALIVISLYFVKGNGNEENVKINKKWVITITLSVIFAGVFGILQRHQQLEFSGKFDNEFMIVSLAISGLTLLIMGIVKDGKSLKSILKNGSHYALGAGVSNGATNLLTLYLYTLAPMSFVAPMNAGVAIFVSFLISKLIFKEKFSVLQYCGVIIGGIALILFNL